MDGNAFTGETKRQIPTLELAYNLLVLTVRNAGNSCPLLEKKLAVVHQTVVAWSVSVPVNRSKTSQHFNYSI